MDDGRSSRSSSIGHFSESAAASVVDTLSVIDDCQEDSEKDASLDWNELTVEQVLDVPIWSGLLKAVEFDDMMTFEDFLMRSQNILQLELASRDYDTFTSFIDFYNGFKASGKSFVPFVSGYNDDLLGSLEGDGLSCVGLSVRLMGKLTESDLRIRNHLGLVSCEEVVKDVGSYCMESPNAVKEHVLVALHIVVEGNRRGYVLFDPGYHVARPGEEYKLRILCLTF